VAAKQVEIETACGRFSVPSFPPSKYKLIDNNVSESFFDWKLLFFFGDSFIVYEEQKNIENEQKMMTLKSFVQKDQKHDLQPKNSLLMLNLNFHK
jgi:hypothetical protein